MMSRQHSPQFTSISQRATPRGAEGMTRGVYGKSRAPRRFPDLPQNYYHSHFTDMLAKVAGRYENCLDEEPAKFIEDFHALPRHAQCAYVRIAGRKASVFETKKLKYSEIDNLNTQFEILREAGFINSVSNRDVADYLNVLTKPDLIGLMEKIRVD